MTRWSKYVQGWDKRTTCMSLWLENLTVNLSGAPLTRWISDAQTDMVCHAFENIFLSYGRLTSKQSQTHPIIVNLSWFLAAMKFSWGISIKPLSVEGRSSLELNSMTKESAKRGDYGSDSKRRNGVRWRESSHAEQWSCFTERSNRIRTTRRVLEVKTGKIARGMQRILMAPRGINRWRIWGGKGR